MSKKEILRSVEALPPEDRVSMIQSLIQSLPVDEANDLENRLKGKFRSEYQRLADKENQIITDNANRSMSLSTSDKVQLINQLIDEIGSPQVANPKELTRQLNQLEDEGW